MKPKRLLLLVSLLIVLLIINLIHFPVDNTHAETISSGEFNKHSVDLSRRYNTAQISNSNISSRQGNGDTQPPFGNRSGNGNYQYYSWNRSTNANYQNPSVNRTGNTTRYFPSSVPPSPIKPQPPVSVGSKNQPASLMSSNRNLKRQ